jgi:hypothetical protein
VKRILALILMILLSCAAGAQEIRRPTADIDNTGADCPGSATAQATSMANAYDASGAATSSSFAFSGVPTSTEKKGGRSFTTWASPSGSYSSLSVNYNITFTDNGVGLTDTSNVEFSTDGGSSWNIFSGTTATLSPAQSLSTLQVRFCTSVLGSAGGPVGRSTVAAFDIWTSGVLNPPPAQPTGLSATPAGNGLSVALTWTDNATNETSYQINKCSGVSCTPVSYQTGLATNLASFNDTTGVSPGTTYGYQACAVNSSGTVCSTTSTATTPQIPAAPTGIATSYSNTTITISWNDIATTETNYVLQRCLGSGCSPVDYQTLGANTTTFTDTSINGKTIYTYNVLASNAVGRSSGTGNATVITSAHQPNQSSHTISQ